MTDDVIEAFRWLIAVEGQDFKAEMEARRDLRLTLEAWGYIL